MPESTDDADNMVSKTDKMANEKAMSYSSSMAIINKINALKQNISGGSSHDKPAELFRKDLISAMKLADSEALKRDDYCLISDHWRQDWEKGVQVPVNPTALKHCQVNFLKENEKIFGPYTCKLPKKLLHAVADETYKQGVHELHETQKLADEVCRYDLDELDVTWLSNYNCLRLQQGDAPLTEYEMERVMEALETRCYDGMQEAMKNVGLVGIEYDEDVVCDICRSPESEDGNEMIFCDACDVCVHQACYGVHKIPSGSWLCRACALGIKPRCVLCPNTGGAMKSTHDGSQWAHLSCALWIPEIAIVDTEKMEPIDKISEIPVNRWNLICNLCRERTGACIQCSVKKCKTAFHVTCAFQDNLEMKTNIDEGSELVLKGYCTKHSGNRDSIDGSSPKKGPSSTPKKHSEMTEEEKKAEKAKKMQKLAEEFYTYVGELKQLSELMELDIETVDILYSYWFLKRKSNFNRPLMTPKVEEGDLLLKQREDGMIARLKMFLHLRQDLERVRNLCYMVSRREKLRNQYLDAKRSIFMQQVAILRSQTGRCLGARDHKSVITAHQQSTSIYDRPEAVMRTAQCEHLTSSLNGKDEDVCVKADDDSLLLPKVSKVVGRGRGRPPGSSNSAKSAVVRPKSATVTPASTENPYARPTYKSFSWLVSSRRRSMETGANTSTPTTARGSCKRPRKMYAETPNASATDMSLGENFQSLENNTSALSLVSGREFNCDNSSSQKRCKRIRLEIERMEASSNLTPVLVKDESLQSVIDVGTDEKVFIDIQNAIAAPSTMTPGNSLSSDVNEDTAMVMCVKLDCESVVEQQSPESIDVETISSCLDKECDIAPSREPLLPACVNTSISSHFNGCYSPVIIQKQEATPERLLQNATCSSLAKLNSRHFSDVLLTNSPTSTVEPANVSSAVLDKTGENATSIAVPTANGLKRQQDQVRRGLKCKKRVGNKKFATSIEKFRQTILDKYICHTKSSSDSGIGNGHASAESTTVCAEDSSDDIGVTNVKRRLSMRPPRKSPLTDDTKTTVIHSGDSDSCDTLLNGDTDSFDVDDVSNSSWNRRCSLRSSLGLVSSR